MGWVAAAVGVVGSVATAVIGAKQQSDAKDAIDRYNRQQLKTVTEEIGVSTLGSDLQREELARATATGLSALQAGGSRALVGGIGQLQQGVNLQGREIGAGLDAQQIEINKLIAQDKARIQLLKEQREREDLSGLGQQLAVGQQNLFKGIAGAAQGVASVANLTGVNKTGSDPSGGAVNTPTTNTGYNPFGGSIGYQNNVGYNVNPFIG